MIATVEGWVGSIVGGVLVVGYLAFVAVGAFRRGHDAAMAEIDDALSNVSGLS